jgi:hypothetical protein
VAHDLLGRDDPGLHHHGLDQQRDLLAALSLWALVSGHWSAWQAARVEVEQARQAEQKEQEDVPGEIVERVVAETDVQSNDR